MAAQFSSCATRPPVAEFPAARFDPGLTIRLVLAIVRASRRRIQVIGSTTWSMADGKIFTGNLQRDDLQGWAVVLTYSYIALGEYYSGAYHRGFRRKKKAESFLDRFPRNTPFPVRFKPGKPETSTLLLTDLSLLLAGL